MAKTVEIIPPRRPTRRQSLRSLLAEIRAYRRACDAGLISSADAQRRVAMVHSEAELWLSLKLLEMQGQDAPIDMALTDEDYTPPQITPHRVKKVSVKEGIGRHGERINEKSVTVQTSSPGDDPETEAEIEALT